MWTMIDSGIVPELIWSLKLERYLSSVSAFKIRQTMYKIKKPKSGLSESIK